MCQLIEGKGRGQKREDGRGQSPPAAAEIACGSVFRNAECGARFQQPTGSTALVGVLIKRCSKLDWCPQPLAAGTFHSSGPRRGSTKGRSPTYSPAPSSIATLPLYYVDAHKGRRGQGTKGALTGMRCAYSCSKACRDHCKDKQNTKTNVHTYGRSGGGEMLIRLIGSD